MPSELENDNTYERGILKRIKYSLLYIYRNIRYGAKVEMFKAEWRKRNRHNLTSVSDVFPVDCVVVGRYTYGNLNVCTYGNENERLIIGSFCSIAGSARFILSGEHNYKLFSTYPFKRTIGDGQFEAISKGPIIIDDDVWIGDSAIILSGVHIHRGAVVGAGTVVSQDIPPYAIVSGNPARIMKYRFDDKLIEQLMKIDYSSLSDDDIISHMDFLYENLENIDQLEWIVDRELTRYGEDI